MRAGQVKTKEGCVCDCVCPRHAGVASVVRACAACWVRASTVELGCGGSAAPALFRAPRAARSSNRGQAAAPTGVPRNLVGHPPQPASSPSSQETRQQDPDKWRERKRVLLQVGLDLQTRFTGPILYVRAPSMGKGGKGETRHMCTSGAARQRGATKA